MRQPPSWLAHILNSQCELLLAHSHLKCHIVSSKNKSYLLRIFTEAVMPQRRRGSGSAIESLTV